MICGLDLGSRNVKLVLLDQGGVVRKEVYNTIDFYKERTLALSEGICLDKNRLDIPEAVRLVVTGYGRNNLGLRGTEQITEVKAQIVGAKYQTGTSDFVLLDIGGQDIKVIRVEKGRVVNLHMNDKCAAGSGRYLEGMAAILGVSLDEIGKYYEDPVIMDSTCAIYGESELVGKLAEGYPIPNLCAGVNEALFRRILPMLSDLPKGERLICSGGVAQNRGIINLLARNGYKPEILNDPISNGAIGCAIWGLKRFPGMLVDFYKQSR